MTDRALAPTQKQATARAMTAASGILQRKCACGTHTMGSECEECKKKKGLLQRAPLSSCGRGTQGEGEVPPIVHEVLRSPGQPLDAETRAFFEPRFGQDFSQVRVHTDAKAADSARAVNALAYTVGRDVVFEASQYAPGTIAGRIVLAHELTHVIQQDAMYGGSVRAIGLPGDRHEKEAEVTGIAIGAGIKRSLSIQGGRSPILRRVSFGTDGDLSPSRKAMVTKAAAIAERLVMERFSPFRQKWEAFWKGPGAAISPKPSLEAYQAAVRGRIVHDADSSSRREVKELIASESTLPLERQTAAATPLGSFDTYMRRFAIDQGVDSVVSLLLHESLHGAGLPMGPLALYEPFFHGFEAEAGFPMMMGGADITDIYHQRTGDFEVDVTITFNLRKIGKQDLSKNIEIEVVSPETGDVVYDEQPDGKRLPAKQPIPSKVGQGKWVWHARNPGWADYTVRIRDLTTPTLLGSRQFQTRPRCVAGVSTVHCEGE